MRAPGGYQVGGLKTKSSRAFNRHPGVQGHQRPVGGMLDNDPAILLEDSEDWIEDRAGSVLIVVSDSAISASGYRPGATLEPQNRLPFSIGPVPRPNSVPVLGILPFLTRRDKAIRFRLGESFRKS